MVENADLIVMGTSHNELPIEKREHFHLIGDRLDRTGNMLMHVWGIHEFMLLNTCNRIEIIAVVSRGTEIDDLLKRIMAFFHLKPREYYMKQGYEAFEHTATLCAGLYSQTPGENHIVAQVKDALAYSREKDWAGNMMDNWISSALQVSKVIRNKTGPLLKNVEIEDLCVNYLQNKIAKPADRNILVIGAGVVGTDLVKSLIHHGMTCKWCYNVNKPDISDPIFKDIGLCSVRRLQQHLAAADVVLCAAMSAGHVITRKHAPAFAAVKHPYIIDLAIPRNTDPGLSEKVPHLRIVDLDDLKHWFRRELADMPKIYKLAGQQVKKHKDKYERIIKSFQGGNKIQ
jgi:glutamyl-tRNA reductase